MRNTLDRVGMCQLCSEILTSHDVLTTGQAKWCAACLAPQQAAARKHSDAPDSPVPTRPNIMNVVRTKSRKSVTVENVASPLLAFDSPTIPQDQLWAWWNGLSTHDQLTLWNTLIVPEWMNECSLTKLIAAALSDSRGDNAQKPGRLWLEVAYHYRQQSPVAI